MATLDVSRVLLDPKLASRGIIATGLKLVMGDNGRGQKTETTHTNKWCSDD